MPLRKTYKRRPLTSRRTYRKKKTTYTRPRTRTSRTRTYKPRSYVHRPLSNNGLPNVLTTKLKYCSAFTLTTPAAATLGNYTWLLNSLFDPEGTGVGHQPYLFDQIKPLYTNYLVYGCYINLQLSSITSSQGMTITGTRINNSTSAPPTSWDYLKEIGHTAFINVIAGANPRQYRRYVSISKAIGVNFQSYMTDPDYKTAMNSSPTLSPTLSLSYGSADGSTNPSIYIELTLTFYCKFFQLITAAQS